MPNAQIHKSQQQSRRRGRIRARISGTAARPRFSVYRSLQHIYAQLIDDDLGVTLAAAQDTEIKTKGTRTEVAKQVGSLLAERAKAKGVTQVTFDRGGRKYHGRVKAVADGAREGGLDF
jgi:large subunit ribosomal protein L18